jgi:hypothetical protein
MKGTFTSFLRDNITNTMQKKVSVSGTLTHLTQSPHQFHQPYLQPTRRTNALRTQAALHCVINGRCPGLRQRVSCHSGVLVKWKLGIWWW